MKRPIYLLSLLGFAALAVAGGDPVTLRLSLDKPFTQNYLVETKMVQQIDLSAAGQGEQEMVMNTSMLYKYDVAKAAEDGKADMKTTVSDIKVEMEGGQGAPGMDMPKEIVMKGKVDNLGKMYEMKVEGQVNPQIEAMMGRMQGMNSDTETSAVAASGGSAAWLDASNGLQHARSLDRMPSHVTSLATTTSFASVVRPGPGAAAPGALAGSPATGGRRRRCPGSGRAARKSALHGAAGPHLRL